MKKNTLFQKGLNMNKDIFEMVESINCDYLKLLKKLDKIKFDSNNINSIIDEINVFWKIHKRNALFIINNLSEYDYDTCFFTCACGIEIDQNEYEPFVLSADNKIYDDKLPQYFEILTKCKDNQKTKYLSEINYLIKNYVKLLEKSISEIFIVPISYFLLKPKEMWDLTNILFLDLFSKKFNSVDEYFNSIKNKDDFLNVSKQENCNLLILSNKETQGMSLTEKIECFIGSPIPNANFPEKAYFAYTTAIVNALSCLTVSTMTGFIPYLRNRVAFYNVVSISTNVYAQIMELEQSMPKLPTIIFYLYVFYKETNFKLSTFEISDTLKHISLLAYISKRINDIPAPDLVRTKECKDFLKEYLIDSKLIDCKITIS